MISKRFYKFIAGITVAATLISQSCVAAYAGEIGTEIIEIGTEIGDEISEVLEKLPTEETSGGEVELLGEGETGDFVLNGTTITGLTDTGKTKTTITIPGGITAIGNSALKGGAYNKVIISSNELTKIGTYAFENNKNITEIEIPENLTSIGMYAFKGCTSLKKVTVKSNKLTSIGTGIFEGCSIESFTLPTGIEKIPNNLFNHAGFVNMNLVIPASVTEIGNSAFEGASGIKTITFEGTALNKIGQYAFTSQKNITEIIIPENVTTIGMYAFRYCSNLKRVVIKGNKITSVGTSIFEGSKIESIIWSAEVTKIPGNLFSYAGFVDMDFVIPASVTTIEKSAFSNAKGINKYIFAGTGVTSIGENAFSANKNITEIDIPQNVTTIGAYAFRDCSNLKKVNVNSKVISSVSSSVFEGCKIENVTWPEGITRITGNLFSYAGFNNIDFVVPESVTAIGKNAFKSSKNMHSITFAGDKVTTIGDEAFRANKGITELEIPASVTSLGSYVIKEATNLKKVVNNSNCGCTLPVVSGKTWINKMSGATITSIKNGTAIRDDFESDILEIDKEELEKMVRNAMPTCSGATAIIQGPSVEIAGEEYVTFELGYENDFKFGDKTIPLSFAFDSSDNSLEVVIGVEMDKKELNLDKDANFVSAYKDIKSFYKSVAGKNASTEKLFNKYKKLRNRLKAGTGSIGFEANTSVCGYLNLQLAQNKDGLIYISKVNEGGMVVTSEAELSASSQLPPPFTLFYGELSGSFSGNGKLKFINEGKRIVGLDRLELDVDGDAGVGVAVGIGNEKLDMFAKGGIEGKLGTEAKILPWLNARNNIKVNADLNGFVEWCWWKIPFLTGEAKVNLVHAELYPNRNVDTIISKKMAYYRPKAITRSSIMKFMAATSDQIDSDDAIYRFSNIQAVKINDGRILVTYLDDNVEGYDGLIKLMYRTYDGSSWSEGKVVYTGGYVDSSARLCVDNDGNPFIVFASTVENIADGAEADTVISKLATYVSKFDGTGFVTPVQLVDTGVYAYSYNIVNEGGTVKAVWVENQDNTIMPASGSTTVYERIVNSDLSLSDKTTVSNYSDGVENIITGIVNDEVISVYLDGASSLYINDIKVFEAKDGKSVSAPKITDGKLYFIYDGSLYSYDGVTVSDALIECNSTYKIAGNIVYYTAGDGFYSEIYKKELDSENPAICLTKDEGCIADYFVVADDSEDEILYSYQEINKANANPFGLCTLKYAKNEERYGASIANVGYDVNDFSPNKDNIVYITIENTGTTELADIKLTADNAYVSVEDTVILDTLLPGEIKEVEAEVNFADGYDRSDVTFGVTANHVIDDLETANYSFDFSTADIDVTSSDENTVIVNSNLSAALSGVTVSLYDGVEDDENIIRTIDNIDIASEESFENAITAEDWEKATVDKLGNVKAIVVVASVSDTEREYELSNNSVVINKKIDNVCEHDFSEKTVDPTETERGYTLHICSECEASYRTDFVDALGSNDDDDDNGGDQGGDSGDKPGDKPGDNQETDEKWLEKLVKKDDSTYILNLATKEKYELTELAKSSADGKNYKIEYSSTVDIKVASMNPKGLIVAKKEGKSVIRLLKGDKNYTITVNVYNPQFTFTDSKAKYYATNVGEKIIPEYDHKYLKPIFELDKAAISKGIATINAKTGEVKALKKGKVTVTAIVGEGKNARKVSAKVMIYDPVLFVKAAEVNVGKTLALKVKNGASKPATQWSIVSGQQFATIDEKGKLKGIAPGEVTVKAINNGREMTIKINVI